MDQVRPSRNGTRSSPSGSTAAAPTSCPRASYDWTRRASATCPGRARHGGDAWHPEDALFLPMRHSDGHLLGILSVDEPVNRRRPTDEELDVLVPLADHAALAIQAAQESAEAARHRLALEQLLEVSSRLTAEPVADEILRDVCAACATRSASSTSLAQLTDPVDGRLEPARRRRLGSRRRCASDLRLRRRRAAPRPGLRGRRAASSCRTTRRSAGSRATSSRTRRS